MTVSTIGITVRMTQTTDTLLEMGSGARRAFIPTLWISQQRLAISNRHHSAIVTPSIRFNTRLVAYDNRSIAVAAHRADNTVQVSRRSMKTTMPPMNPATAPTTLHPGISTYSCMTDPISSPTMNPIVKWIR